MKKKIGLVLATVVVGLALAGFALALSNGMDQRATSQRLDLLLEQGFPVSLTCNDGVNKGGRIPFMARIRPVHVIDQSGIDWEENRITYIVRVEEKPPEECLFNDGSRITVHFPDIDTRKGH